MSRTAGSLRSEIVRRLKQVRATDPTNRERRTSLLRDIAELKIELREHYLTDDGEPDWAGKTYAYRAATRELYSQAGYAADEAQATQAAIRYHVGNLIRERVSAEELADLGLRDVSPKERAKASRDARSALLASLQESAEPDALRSVTAALQLVKMIGDDRLAGMSDGDRAVMRVLSRELVTAATRLRDETR